MKKVLHVLSILMMGLMIATGSIAAVTVGEPAPDFTLTDTLGASHSLSDFKGKYVVLEWVNYQCPFVKKFYQSGKMQELQKEFTGKDAVWLSINSSAKGKQGYYSAADVNKIMENSKAAPTAYLLDTSGEVGKTYAAKTTPHMYIVGPEGRLIYQGAIDNMPSADPSDIPEATNYVAEALTQAMSGVPVASAQTKSYGCGVKY